MSGAPRNDPVPQSERYEIRSRLGAGASGVVYAAFDRQRKVPVALKTLRRVDADGVLRLKQEFRARADVAHPNLVSLFELEQEPEGWLLSMELVDGMPFLQWVRGSSWRPRRARSSSTLGADPESTTFEEDDGVDDEGSDPQLVEPETTLATDLERLRGSFRQLADGVAALHRARRLHRDLKPANVLVTSGGRVVVVDFGLVTDLQKLSAGKIAGTAAYMAPEQAAGNQLSEASDWYAVGVMLYEALTGRRPFEGGIAKVLAEKQAYDAVSAAEICPGVPADLDALTTALLARNPTSRPAAGEILAALGGDAPTPAPSLDRLVGRSLHLASLDKAWRKTGLGQPVLAWVRGRSGMGKSTLLERFREQLQRSPGAAIPVVSGRCFERETVAYNAFDQVVDALAAWNGLDQWLPADSAALVRLFPALRRTRGLASVADAEAPDPQQLRERGFTAFGELLAAMAPAVIVLDDVQWGDADSAQLLDALLMTRAPLLFVLSYRSEDENRSPFLQAVLHRAEAAGVIQRTIDVSELAPREALDLALTFAERDGETQITDAVAQDIVRESGGNPLFVEELCRQAQRGNGLTARPDLDAAIRNRAQTVPDAARALLELLAVAGRPVALAALGSASGLEDALPMVDVLRSARLARSGPAGLESQHDRVREAMVRGIEPDRLRALHGAWVRALGDDADPEALAVHWEGAGEPARAAEHAKRAAQQAEDMLAFDRAARRWNDVQRLTGGGDVTTLERWGAALANAGRGAEAARAFQQAAPLSTGDRALELQRRTAEELLNVGLVDEGLLCADAVLRSIGLRITRDPRRAVPPLLWERFRLWLRGLEPSPRRSSNRADPFRLTVLRTFGRSLAWVDFLQGELLLVRHLRGALDAGIPEEITVGLCAAMTTLSSGSARDRARVEEIRRRVVALAGPNPTADVQLSVHLADALVAFNAGAFRETVDRARTGDAHAAARCVGVEFERTSLDLLLLWGLLFQGDLRATTRELSQALRRARDRGNQRFIATASTEIQSMLLLAADQPEEATSAVDEYTHKWGRPGVFNLPHQSAMLARGWIHAYTGDAALGFRTLEDTWPQLERSLLLHHRFIRLEGWLLRARCALAWAKVCGEGAPMRLARRSLREAAVDPAPWSEAIRLHIEGSCDHAEGQTDAAVAAWRASLAACEATDQRLQAAAVRRRLGLVLGGEEGAAMTLVADRFLVDQGVRRPEAVTRMILGS